MRRWFVRPGLCEERRDLRGAVVVVTGCAAGGIGQATAELLCAQGAHVVVTTRDAASAEACAAGLCARHGAGSAEGRALDLAEDGSVDEFARWFAASHGKLDILVNNAGIHLDLLGQWREPKLARCGDEIMWRVNFVGTVRLTERLLPLLRRAADEGSPRAEARVVMVISELHRLGTDKCMARALATGGRETGRPYSSWNAYGQSKLAVLLYAKELSRRCLREGVAVTANCLHPGAVLSNVADHGLEGNSALLRVRRALRPLEAWMLKTPTEGAQTSLFCAIASELDGVSGRYFKDCAEAESSAASHNAECAAELLDGVRARLELHVPKQQHPNHRKSLTQLGPEQGREGVVG